MRPHQDRGSVNDWSEGSFEDISIPAAAESPNAIVESMLAALRAGLVSRDDQMAVINEMSIESQRDLVQRLSSLDSSLLLTFKKQVALVDTVLRKLVNPDGTAVQGSEDYDINLKDALTLSLRVTQIMVKEMPKLYSLERLQRQEEALRRVMEKHMTPEQQDLMLEELEEVEKEMAAR